MEILGMEDTFFWVNVFYISIFAMLGLFVFFAIKFIFDSRGFDKGSAQKGYYLGLGLFILSVAIGESFYLLDLVFRTNFGNRIFYQVEPGQSVSFNWPDVVGYPITSLMNRDYYIAIFLILLISLSFLMKPLEKFMLRRETPVVTYLNRILIPAPILIRVFELNLNNWFGTQVLEGSVPYYIFTVLWIFVIGVIIVSILMLLGLYLKMGIKSPKGSNLRKKSFMIILGILFWLMAVFLTNTIHDQIDGGDWYYFPVVPLLLVLSLSSMMYGFKREF